jgi:hypothetical protein
MTQVSNSKFAGLFIFFILISLFFSSTIIFSDVEPTQNVSVLAESETTFWPEAESAETRSTADDPFTLVLLPDSQIYAKNYPHIYTNQTWWIVNNSARLNIQYVLHEGDITNNNNIAQWTNANTSQHIMDGKVPYTLSPGNHDLGPNGNAANRDTYMNDYFNVTQYETWPTLGGVFESGKMENSYHLFTADGLDWMIVSLEFAPRDAVLAWANQVVSQYSDRIVFVVTHNYMAGNARNGGYGGNYGLINAPEGAASGEDIWQYFVRKHRNILCVFSGHILVEAGYLKSVGDEGNTVHQMMANFQMNSNGGNGFLRLLKFDVDQGKIDVKTYSPYVDSYRTESYHQFELDFDKWWYVNDEPVILNNITSFELTEDDDERYLMMDGNLDQNNGIFYDENMAHGDKLTYYIWNGKKWSDYGDFGIFENQNLTVMILDNGSLEVLPKPDRFGSDSIKLKAEDSVGAFITTKVQITIHPLNDAPIINDTILWNYSSPPDKVWSGKIRCLEDSWANFTVTAYDPLDAPEVTDLEYSTNSTMDNAPFFKIDPTSGYITLRPTNEDVGVYYLKIVVDDNGAINNIAEYDLMLEVLNTNDPPTITNLDVLECYEDQLYSVEYSAIDVDPTNDDFVWNVISDTTFLMMNPASGVLNGTPENSDVGEYFVNVTVSDKNGGFNFSNFILVVHNTNDPPIITNYVQDFKFLEDTIDNHLNLSSWFGDIDGDELVFHSDTDENMTILISANGSVRLIPKANWSGSGTLTFYANDSLAEVKDSVDYNVKAVNDAPFVPEIELLIDKYYEGSAQLVLGNASDVDLLYGDELYFRWSSNVTGKLDSGEMINLSLPSGYHTITLTVRDKAGAKCNVSIGVEVLPNPNKMVEPPTTKDESDATGSGNIYLALGVVIGIIIFIVIFFIFLKHKKSKLDSESETTPSIPTIPEPRAPIPPTLSSTHKPKTPKDKHGQPLMPKQKDEN